MDETSETGDLDPTDPEFDFDSRTNKAARRRYKLWSFATLIALFIPPWWLGLTVAIAIQAIWYSRHRDWFSH